MTAMLELPSRVTPRSLPGRTLANEQDWLDQWLWLQVEIVLADLQTLPVGLWMAYPAARFARLAFVAAEHGYQLRTARSIRLPEDLIRVQLEWPGNRVE